MIHQQHQSNTFQRCLWRQRWTKIIKPLWIGGQISGSNFPKILRNNGNQSLIPMTQWLCSVPATHRRVRWENGFLLMRKSVWISLINWSLLASSRTRSFFSMIFCKLRRRCNFFVVLLTWNICYQGFLASFFFDQIQNRTCTFLLMCKNKKTRNGREVRNNIKHFRWGTPHDIKEPSGYKTPKTSHNFSTPSWPCPPRGQSSQPRECLGRASGVGLNSQRWQPSIGTKLCIYI